MNENESVVNENKYPVNDSERAMVDENEVLFNRAVPSTFIRNMLVYYDGELVSRFRTSSALADNPLFTFKMKAVKEAPLKVVFIDDEGERWETSKDVKFKS